MHIAANDGEEDIVEILLRNGAIIDEVDVRILLWPPQIVISKIKELKRLKEIKSENEERLKKWKTLLQDNFK